MKNFDGRIGKVEKLVENRHGDVSEAEQRKAFEEFKREAPIWRKEVLAMFSHLLDELVRIESYRNPEEFRGDLKTFFYEKFSHILEDVKKRIEALPSEELEKVDRARVIAEFQGIVSKSDNLSDQARDDLLKILSNPHKGYDNSRRRVFGLPLLETEDGPEWRFSGEGWWYTGGNLLGEIGIPLPWARGGKD